MHSDCELVDGQERLALRFYLFKAVKDGNFGGNIYGCVTWGTPINPKLPDKKVPLIVSKAGGVLGDPTCMAHANIILDHPIQHQVTKIPSGLKTDS